MRLRSTLLVVGLLLFGVSLAGADSSLPPASPVPGGVTDTQASGSVVLTGSTCGEGSSPALLPALSPEAPQAMAVMCGSCSGVCAGAKPNSICAGGTRPKMCQIQSTCTTGGFSCVCTNLPPP